MTCPARTCTAEAPHSHLPLLPPEVVAARFEDPHFAEVLGRARARARDEEYRPQVHYPHRYGGHRAKADTANDEKVEKLRADWMARGGIPNRAAWIHR